VEAKTSKQYAYAFASHKYFTASMLIATFIALFAMDLWELSGEREREREIVKEKERGEKREKEGKRKTEREDKNSKE